MNQIGVPIKKMIIVLFIFFISVVTVADTNVLKSGDEIDAGNTLENEGQLRCNMHRSIVDSDIDTVDHVENVNMSESSTAVEAQSNTDNTVSLGVWRPDPQAQSYAVLKYFQSITLQKVDDRFLMVSTYYDGSNSVDEIVWKSKIEFEKKGEEKGEYYRLEGGNLVIYDKTGWIGTFIPVRINSK